MSQWRRFFFHIHSSLRYQKKKHPHFPNFSTLRPRVEKALRILKIILYLSGDACTYKVRHYISNGIPETPPYSGFGHMLSTCYLHIRWYLLWILTSNYVMTNSLFCFKLFSSGYRSQVVPKEPANSTLRSSWPVLSYCSRTVHCWYSTHDVVGLGTLPRVWEQPRNGLVRGTSCEAMFLKIESSRHARVRLKGFSGRMFLRVIFECLGVIVFVIRM